jgi:hypothetical protein
LSAARTQGRKLRSSQGAGCGICVSIHAVGEHPGVAQSVKEKTLAIQDSLQIKAAESRLELGEADQALKELETLPSRIWKCGWALKTRIAAMGALRERDEKAVQV